MRGEKVPDAWVGANIGVAGVESGRVVMGLGLSSDGTATAVSFSKSASLTSLWSATAFHVPGEEEEEPSAAGTGGGGMLSASEIGFEEDDCGSLIWCVCVLCGG